MTAAAITAPTGAEGARRAAHSFASSSKEGAFTDGRRSVVRRALAPAAPACHAIPMRPFVPRRLEPVAFGLLLSGLMSLLVSGVSTFLAIGAGPGFAGTWLGAWVSSWAVAFPAVLVVAPIVRRVLSRIVLPR